MAKRKTEAEAERPILEIGRPILVRWIVLLALAGLAGLIASMAVGAVARHPLAALGLAAGATILLILLVATWRSAAARLRFDGERLTDDTGAELCRLDEIVKVERGFIFLKPSTGFLLVLRGAKPFAWAPGLWWRIGRRIGVGGSTSRQAGKVMAEAISLELARRNGG